MWVDTGAISNAKYNTIQKIIYNNLPFSSTDQRKAYKQFMNLTVIFKSWEQNWPFKMITWSPWNVLCNITTLRLLVFPHCYHQCLPFDVIREGACKAQCCTGATDLEVIVSLVACGGPIRREVFTVSSFFLFFFKKFFLRTQVLSWGNWYSFLDLWWHLPWVSKPGWIPCAFSLVWSSDSPLVQHLLTV